MIHPRILFPLYVITLDVINYRNVTRGREGEGRGGEGEGKISVL